MFRVVKPKGSSKAGCRVLVNQLNSVPMQNQQTCSIVSKWPRDVFGVE